MNVSTVQFSKAVKTEAKLRLALSGVSGGGKTYTALLVATHLITTGRIALVDTEHGSASKYADIFDFDTVSMSAPFMPTKYVQAIRDAAIAGYEVVILDSLSHAWNGPGGLLEMVDQIAKKYQGNTYAAWSEGTPIQNQLIEAIVGAPVHIIGTMRSKSDYILVENERGKSVPKKVGMAPVQRDGFGYEFDAMIDLDLDNFGVVVKTRCPALHGMAFDKPGEDLAKILADWLSDDPEEVTPLSYKNGTLVKPEDETELLAFETYIELEGSRPASRAALMRWRGKPDKKPVTTTESSDNGEESVVEVVVLPPLDEMIGDEEPVQEALVVEDEPTEEELSDAAE